MPAAMAMLSWACSGDVQDAAPGIQQGTLEARWTIEGTTEVDRCTAHDAVTMRVVVVDASGVARGSILAPCEEFRGILRVRAGLYDLSATFFGADGQVTSGSLAASHAIVEGDSTTVIPFAFTAELMELGRTRQAR